MGGIGITTLQVGFDILKLEALRRQISKVREMRCQFLAVLVVEGWIGDVHHIVCFNEWGEW
jgi:hypothetical protein